VEDVLKRRTSQTPAHRADLIRLCILEEHGGVWLDMTSILMEDLSWIEKITQNPDVINLQPPGNLEPTEVIFFYNELLGQRVVHEDQYQHKYNTYPGYENWFIASAKKARFITLWKN
jgi:hypothetical protein